MIMFLKQTLISMEQLSLSILLNFLKIFNLTFNIYVILLDLDIYYLDTLLSFKAIYGENTVVYTFWL